MDRLLPAGVRRRTLPGINGLSMHLLEAGDPAHPLVLLLHGFPELAYSWRHQLAPLAAAGFHVVAPDQRGFGGTTGEDRERLEQFRLLNLVTDAMALVSALGHSRVHLLVGHDFGSPVAALAALARPDIFRAVVLMSAPFAGVPGWPLAAPGAGADWQAELGARNLRHYQWYFADPRAAAEMDRPAGGMHAFLRAYYHVKSGDWAGNAGDRQPFALAGWTGAELAKLPPYYVMPADRTMPETVAPFLPAAEAPWLTDAELGVYAEAFGRTGFGGGLLWYRAVTSGRFAADFQLFAGRRIQGPALFLAGDRDWGIHQTPGALAAMERRAGDDWRGTELIPGAGHWVQQERAEAVTARLLDFALALPRQRRPDREALPR